MNRALFLDRDGVVADLVYYPSHDEWEAARTVDDLSIQERIEEPLREAMNQGWLLFLITNQPSYAKGKCSLEGLQAVHQRILEELANRGVTITDSYVCYHHPESALEGYGPCDCRKPSPHFIREAAKKYDVDLAQSWMVGDQDTDVETGRRAGCRTALLHYPRSANKRGAAVPDLDCADLRDFIRKITLT